MPHYATTDDLDAYAEIDITDPAFVGRVIDRAERDLDQRVLGPWPVDAATGLKFGQPRHAGAPTNPQGLTTLQIDALKRATCAQAEYRIEMGERFFSRPQRERTKGPDFEVE